MTKKIGVIGHPLGHTLSPVFQQAGLDAAGLDATCLAMPTTPEELEERITSFRDPEVMGACVTLPHKQAVMPLLDEIDAAAEEIAAVNWIINSDGKLTGHNTDAPGFLRAMREELDFEPNGKDVVVLGAGGAARAIVFALREAGVARLTIANRTVENAVALSEEARRVRFRPTAIGLTKDDLSDAVPYADAIVNTTSMGMAGGPNPGNSPVSADLISDRSVIYDIVYAPQVTPLIHQAEQAGARGVTGLSMLVYQGVIGFELCTGQTAPAEVMLSAARVASEAM